MQSGKMRPLAVAYGSRLAELPNVPTMAEAGLPDFEVTSWNGLAAPAGTPPAIVEKLSAAVNRILQKPRSEEHTSEPQSLMRISYAVFCLKKKKKHTKSK